MNVASGADVVRVPVRLTSTLGRQLVQWCRETAELLDIYGVAQGVVVEALIDQLVEDAGTSESVRRWLTEHASYRLAVQSATPDTTLPRRTLGGARIGQALASCRQPVNVSEAPVAHIGHHRGDAGRPARLGAVRDGCFDESCSAVERAVGARRPEGVSEIEALGA